MISFVDPRDPSIKTAKGPGDTPAVQVSATTAKTVVIAEVFSPLVSSDNYLVQGTVMYDGVEGDGYLELLNEFGVGAVYFTRTLAPTGPMQKLTGSHDWRTFELPFHAEPGMRPQKLTLRVVLPGAGTVTIAQPTLSNYDAPSAWWPERQSGMLGAVLGTLLGMLGGAIGVSTSYGKSRNLTLSLLIVGIATSAIALLLGAVAWSAGQPWHVYYALLLCGGIGTVVFGFNLRPTLKRFRDSELRRLAAADV